MLLPRINIHQCSILATCFLLTFQLNAQTPSRKTTPKLISRFDLSEMVNRTYTISNDMRHIAYRLNESGKQMAVIDGMKGKMYDVVNPPVFSVDGKRFAYSAKSGSKWVIVVDNKVETTIDSISGITAIQFSPDDTRFIYVVNSKKKYYMVINGAKGKSYDYINENSITFGSDNKTIGYAATLGKNQLISIDGSEGEMFDEVGFPAISPGEKHVGYWAKKNDKYVAVIDNRISKLYENVSPITFSPDGKHHAYIATAGSSHLVIYDGVESEKYEVAHSLKFNADGSQFVYGIDQGPGDHEGFKQYVVVNGKKSIVYETIVEGGLIFSPDGKHFAFKAERHDEFFFIIDGKEGKHFGDVFQVTASFSPDNLHFSYSAETDSKRYAVLDEVESGPYNDVLFIAYTNDNKKIVCTIRNGEKEAVVVDGKIGDLYDSIMGQGALVFDTKDTFHYLALKGHEIFLVTEKLN